MHPKTQSPPTATFKCTCIATLPHICTCEQTHRHVRAHTLYACGKIYSLGQHSHFLLVQKQCCWLTTGGKLGCPAHREATSSSAPSLLLVVVGGSPPRKLLIPCKGHTLTDLWQCPFSHPALAISALMCAFLKSLPLCHHQHSRDGTPYSTPRGGSRALAAGRAGLAGPRCWLCGSPELDQCPWCSPLHPTVSQGCDFPQILKAFFFLTHSS